ncbi:DUF6082 family protein [Peterkaempfera sp. SMS 1(5)a]|uniref:DUF6082 family protein n=1 Tax=Peterkaempfera podocarpi TaxID=3232308 RepID=UPI00366D3CBC
MDDRRGRAGNGGPAAAAARGSAGQYFEAAGAVFSGLALLLVVAGVSLQRQELRMQRQELALQRAEMTDSCTQLRRSAESQIRALHVDLLKMAIHDPELARVWPDYDPGLPHSTVRKHLYSNLIFAHMVMVGRMEGVDDDTLRSSLRIIARSADFRAYWSASSTSRNMLPADSEERRFGRLVDEAIAELRDG